MNIPTPEQWRALGEVLVIWGFWAIVYGAIAMSIGLIIILFLSGQMNKAFHYICKNF